MHIVWRILGDLGRIANSLVGYLERFSSAAMLAVDIFES